MTLTPLIIVFPALMACAAVSDLLTMTIPNRLSAALAIAFIFFAAATGLPWTTLLMHLAAGTVVLATCFALFAFGWIGGGDAKLSAAAALWFGFDALADYLVLASLAGGVLTIGLLMMRRFPLPIFAGRWAWLVRLHSPETGVPYGIALAGAAVAAYPHSPVWNALLS